MKLALADAIEVFFPPPETECPSYGSPKIELMLQCISCFYYYAYDLELYNEWRSRLEKGVHYHQF